MTAQRTTTWSPLDETGEFWISQWLDALRPDDDLFFHALVRDRANQVRAALRAPWLAGTRPRFALVVPAGLDFSRQLDRIHVGALLHVAASWIPDYQVCVLRADQLEQAPRAAFYATCLDRELAIANQALNVMFIGADPIPWSRDKIRIRCERPHADDKLSLADRSAVWVPDWYAVPHLQQLRDVAPGATLWASQAWLQSYGSEATRLGFAVSDASHGETPRPAALSTCEPLQSVWLSPTATSRRSDFWLYLGEELRPRLTLARALGAAETVSPASAVTAAATEAATSLISIVVPVYDRDVEVIRLVESILEQSAARPEVLFVTNGSPPDTLAAVRQACEMLLTAGLDGRWIDLGEKCGCATKPRDIGSYAAAGEWIVYVDSDDYLEPGFFSGFARHAVGRAVLYPRKIYRDWGRDMGPDFPWNTVVGSMSAYTADQFADALFSLENFIGNSGAAVRRDWFVRCGGILHSLKYCEDYYLWLATARLGANAASHGGIVSIVLHPGNNELTVGDKRWIARARELASSIGAGGGEVLS